VLSIGQAVDWAFEIWAFPMARIVLVVILQRPLAAQANCRLKMVQIRYNGHPLVFTQQVYLMASSHDSLVAQYRALTSCSSQD
jgi:hypothetical protein